MNHFDRMGSAVLTSAEKIAAKHRLEQAVGRSDRTLSVQGMLEYLFTLAFKGLVYPQIWEDPAVDMEALAITPDSRVVTIASGGCNVMSYLIADPAHITAVDLSLAHVALNRLKLAAVRRLPTWQAFYQQMVEKRPAAEVAAELNLSVTTVYKASHRVKQMLLEEYRHVRRHSGRPDPLPGPPDAGEAPG